MRQCKSGLCATKEEERKAKKKKEKSRKKVLTNEEWYANICKLSARAAAGHKNRKEA